MGKKKSKRYGVCRKGGWKVIAIYPTYEQALNSIRGQEKVYEVREIIYD